MKRSFDLLVDQKGIKLDLASIPAEGTRTCAMIRKADTLGTFQIESRPQMSMLPPLKPRTYYDHVRLAIVGDDPMLLSGQDAANVARASKANSITNEDREDKNHELSS
jgi:hypothetical protein